MTIKNTHETVIGFGNIFVAPEETKKLPVGYTKKHGVIAFYVKQGWVEIIDDGGEAEPDPAPKTADNSSGAAKTAHLDPAKFVEMLDKGLLQLATDLGLQVNADVKREDLEALLSALDLAPAAVAAFDYEKYQDEDYHTISNTAGIHPTDPPEQKAKSLSRMSLDELKAYARVLNLEVADSDTRNILIEKIKPVINAAQ